VPDVPGLVSVWRVVVVVPDVPDVPGLVSVWRVVVVAVPDAPGLVSVWRVVVVPDVSGLVSVWRIVVPDPLPLVLSRVILSYRSLKVSRDERVTMRDELGVVLDPKTFRVPALPPEGPIVFLCP